MENELFNTIYQKTVKFLVCFFIQLHGSVNTCYQTKHLRGVIQKYAEKCHYFHIVNANNIIFVHNQAKFMPI